MGNGLTKIFYRFLMIAGSVIIPPYGSMGGYLVYCVFFVCMYGY